MNEVTYSASTFLLEIARRLESITPDQFIAPDDKAPKGARLVGHLTDNQKALVTLERQIAQQHDEIHTQEGLEFGGNTDLQFEHRLMHVFTGLYHGLMGEDMTQSFPEVRDRPSMIDRNWNVYLLPVKRPRRKSPP